MGQPNWPECQLSGSKANMSDPAHELPSGLAEVATGMVSGILAKFLSYMLKVDSLVYNGIKALTTV
jgi:hypothetical protein